MFDKRQLGSGMQLTKVYLIHERTDKEDAAAGAAQTLARQCEGASAAGLEQAMLYIGLLFGWAALHYWLAARRLRRDWYVAA